MKIYTVKIEINKFATKYRLFNNKEDRKNLIYF